MQKNEAVYAKWRSKFPVYIAEANKENFESLERTDASTGSRHQTSSQVGIPWIQAFVEAFLKTIDCYVMGSRTYETALNFEAKGLGWSYGDKPTFVLTSRELPRTRDTVEFYSGDLSQFVNERLRPAFR